MDRLRIGVLGTGSQAVSGCIKPAATISDHVQVVAVASRDLERASKLAAKYDIARSYGGYEQLLADPDVDAVYIALPNALHCRWALAALETGKHVLVEKPLASNAHEAKELAECSARTGCVVAEGLHHRHHPLLQRVREIVAKGEVGQVSAVEVRYHMPVLSGKDPRYSFELAGGALMDVGVLAIDAARYVLGDCALVCTEASTEKAYPHVDQATKAEFLSPSGATASIDVSIWTPLPRISLVVRGEDGAEITARNWASPHLLYNAILITDLVGSKRTEKFATGSPNPYALQLRAFVDAIAARKDGRDYDGPDADNGFKNLELIDSVYNRVGLPPRGTAIETDAGDADGSGIDAGF